MRKFDFSPRPWLLACLLVTILALFASSCSLRSKVKMGSWDVANMSKSQLVELVNEQNPAVWRLRSSVRASFPRSHKASSVRVDLSIRAGGGMRLIIVPMPLFELGRVWIEPNKLFLHINPINTYCEASWLDISRYFDIDIDYSVLESLLLGRVFPSLSNFLFSTGHLKPDNVELQYNGNIPEIVSYGNSGRTYIFGINPHGRPDYLLITGDRRGELIRVDYLEYEFRPDLGYMPGRIELRHSGPQGVTEVLNLDMNRWRIDDVTSEKDFSPNPKPGANKVSLSELFILINDL